MELTLTITCCSSTLISSSCRKSTSGRSSWATSELATGACWTKLADMLAAYQTRCVPHSREMRESPFSLSSDMRRAHNLTPGRSSAIKPLQSNSRAEVAEWQTR